MNMGQMPCDSLVMSQIVNAVRTKVGSEWISTQNIAELTPQALVDRILQTSTATSLDTDVAEAGETATAYVVAVVTVPSLADEMKLRVIRALASVNNQSRPPDMTMVVFEEKADYSDEALLTEMTAILPCARFAHNERTHGSDSFASAGALNMGIVLSADDFFNGNSWISFLDTAACIWRPTHLQECLSIATADASCQWIMATMASGTMVLPGHDDVAFFAAGVQKSCFFVRRNLMMEAGMFDEALRSRSDDDLYVRLCDVLAEDRHASHCAVTREATVQVARATTDAALARNSNTFNDVDLFFYKHAPRMTLAQKQLVLAQARNDNARLMRECEMGVADDDRDCQLVSLPMWDHQHNVTIRRDVYNTLNSGDDGMAPLTFKPKMLFGIITSDPDRVSHLLGDLRNMLDGREHCVVILANTSDVNIADQISKLMQSQASQFRHHVIQSMDRVVVEMLRSEHCFPLPIAVSRTILQTFLCATTDAEHFDAVAVLDDDMRLPRMWSLREGDESVGDILNGRAIKTPPNPTVMSIRTQLLDFLFALDRLHSDQSKFAEAPEPRQVFTNLQDQYYDLSSARWDHLEMPRQFDCMEAGASFVEQCRYRILVGDPLAREAVSTDQGPTTQRGGCMVLFRKSFDLLRLEQTAPQVQLHVRQTHTLNSGMVATALLCPTWHVPLQAPSPSAIA